MNAVFFCCVSFLTGICDLFKKLGVSREKKAHKNLTKAHITDATMTAVQI